MIKLFVFPDSTPAIDMETEVNAFIADQYEDSREIWEVAGPVTLIPCPNRIAITLVLHRPR